MLAGDPRWAGLVAELQAGLANPSGTTPASPVTIKRHPCPFQVNDLVETQRNYAIGKNRVPDGSIGTVTIIRDHGRLVDVTFPQSPTVTLSILTCELLPAPAPKNRLTLC